MPRYARWFYRLALDGAGRFDDEIQCWVIDVEWEDTLMFPELKGVYKLFIREVKDSKRIILTLSKPPPLPL